MLPKIWTFIAKLLVILVVVLLLTENTDADLIDKESIVDNSIAATTLDFSTRDTANNSQKTLFFNIQGMVKGGFQVGSVRINNDGALPITFNMQAQQTGGDQQVCSSLKLRLFKNWQAVEEAALTDFKYQSSIKTQESQDLILSLELPTTSAAPAHSNCLFTIAIKTLTEESPDAVRFFDEEVLENQVTTGG